MCLAKLSMGTLLIWAMIIPANAIKRNRPLEKSLWDILVSILPASLFLRIYEASSVKTNDKMNRTTFPCHPILSHIKRLEITLKRYIYPKIHIILISEWDTLLCHLERGMVHPYEKIEGFRMEVQQPAE